MNESAEKGERRESRQCMEAYAKAVALKRITPGQVRSTRPCPLIDNAKKTPPSMQGQNNQGERAPTTQFGKATSIGVEYGACTVMPHFSDKRGKRASPGYAWSFFPSTATDRAQRVETRGSNPANCCIQRC
jgi:hypothetical protein